MTYRLPIEKILLDAVRLPWRERRAYIRGLAIPGGMLIAYYAAWWWTGETEIASWMRWTLWAASWLVIMLFVISCHRLALLEHVRQSPSLLPPISRREALFAARALGAGLFYVATQWAVLALAANANPGPRGAEAAGWGEYYWITWIGWFAGSYVFARLSFVFPATAIDERTSFTDAWLRTRGNGWRMLVVVGGVPAVASYATDWLFNEAPGMVAAIAASAVIALFFAVEVTALSLSYRELTRQPPPA